MNLLPSGSFSIPIHWPTWAKHLITAILYLTCWVWIPVIIVLAVTYLLFWACIVWPYVTIHKGIWGKLPSWYKPVEHPTGNGFD